MSAIPVIISSPSSVTVDEGASASFAVSASGVPDPIYQWQKDGVDIVGATGTTLTIASVKSSDSGSYKVIVSNSAGIVSSAPAQLTVNTKAPSIVFDRIEHCCQDIVIFAISGPPNAEISVFSSETLDNWILLVKIKLSSDGKAEYADLTAKGVPTKMYKATLP